MATLCTKLLAKVFTLFARNDSIESTKKANITSNLKPNLKSFRIAHRRGLFQSLFMKKNRSKNILLDFLGSNKVSIAILTPFLEDCDAKLLFIKYNLLNKY